jgi:hypothetical protein
MNALGINNYFEIPLGDTSEFRVLGVQTNGCSTFSDGLEVVPYPAAVARITYADTPVCGTDPFHIKFINEYRKDIYRNGLPYIMYLSGNEFLSHTMVEGDRIAVKTFTEKGCTAESDEIVVRFAIAPPKPGLYRVGDSLYTDYSGDLDWYLNNKLLPGFHGRSYKPVVSGTYSVEAFIIHCSRRSDPYYFNMTGIERTDLESLRIYPNPAMDLVHIHGLPENSLVSISDIRGIRLYSSVASGDLQISLKDFSEGIYMLSIDTIDGYRRVERVILIKN